MVIVSRALENKTNTDGTDKWVVAAPGCDDLAARSGGLRRALGLHDDPIVQTEHALLRWSKPQTRDSTKRAITGVQASRFGAIRSGMAPRTRLQRWEIDCRCRRRLGISDG